MLEVIRVANEIFSSNTYLLFNDFYLYCWLIDIGDYEKLASLLPHNVVVKGVFLTHTHFDHIYGINALYKAFPDCCVYTSSYGKEALYDEKKNMSRYHEAAFTFNGKEVSVLEEGDVIELYPNCLLTVYETPGHCSSCLTYETGNYLFTGDSYIPGVKVVTKLPKGDRFLAKQSVERILVLSKGKFICPGHGELLFNN